MNLSKPFLILQLRPEDDTADSEFAAILNYGNLEEKNVHRIRIEKSGIPEGSKCESCLCHAGRREGGGSLSGEL